MENSSIENNAICSRCGKEIPPEDIDNQTAYAKDGRALCAECVQYVVKKKSEKVSEGSAEILGKISNDITEIKRHITYEHFTLWNILAGFTQIMALVMMFLSFMSNIDLLWAVMFQLMTITFVFFGKK